MGSIELYFYEQTDQQTCPKRYRKLPEELPESLRFAHLNPKVAAYLANKERQQKQDDDAQTDTGNKSLTLPDTLALPHARHRVASSISNEDDTQKYLFEVAKASAASVLQQLAQFLYFYENLRSVVPKSLEYQLMTSFTDLTSDVSIVPREWQTQEAKDLYYIQLKQSHSDDESTDGDMHKPNKENTSDQPKKAKRSPSSKGEQFDDDKDTKVHASLKRSNSRSSIVPLSASRRDSRAGTSKGSRDQKTSAIGNFGQSSYYTVMQFQLSSKVCEEKGWIVQQDKEEAVDHSTVLEHCVQILQETMRAAKNQREQDISQGYDSEAILWYYGDAKKKMKKQLTQKDMSVNNGGKPKIPNMHYDYNEDRKLCFVTHIDGSTVAYYPSGRPSVIYSAAGLGRTGYYTVAYEDGLDSKILACFTPSGRGVCYHPNGVVRFLATAKGGHLADKDGKVIRRWKWPLGVMKLNNPIHFQVHNNIGLRCSSQNQMALVFSCRNEMFKFDISPVPEAVESKPGDENEQLLTSLTFSSKAAKDLMRIFSPKKPKHKSKKKPLKGPLAEIRKLFPERVHYEIESDRDLFRLQRKARILIEDWLEHYRLALGFMSAELTLLQDKPVSTGRRRTVQSATLARASLNLQRATLGLCSTQVEKMRAPSAPAVPDIRTPSTDVPVPSDHGKSILAHNVKFEEKEDVGCDQQSPEISASTAALINRLSESAGKRSYRSKTAESSLPCSRQGAISSLSARVTSAGRSYCPITIRQQYLGYEAPHCRCSRHYIPYIMDIEFEEFIQMETADSQLIVVVVVSSLFPNTSNAEDMLDEIYRNQNRNRTRPCVQSRSDAYRILKYDINTAAQGSDHTHPLLLTRHNVVPGMFLLYADGKLMFCDHIFNGYGNARKDFMKQVMKCRLDAIQGFCLPKDFRFSPSRGRSGRRSAWGGEIGGTGVDKYGSPGTSIDTALIPIHRSHSTSTSDSKEGHLDNVKTLYMSLGPLLNEQTYRYGAYQYSKRRR